MTEPTTPEWQQWRRTCEGKQRLLNQAALGTTRAGVVADVYKAKRFPSCRELYVGQSGPFRGKCAYCEQETYRDQHGDVDHFRPHSSVRDRHWARIRVVIGGIEREHPGYYWLAYDWQNLLPSCVLCNQQWTDSAGRRFGKADRFPVRGGYAVSPGEEADEEPLLIHPVFEDPEEHMRLNDVFHFDAFDDRGETCIDVFGLNDRDLPNARAHKYHEVRNQFGLMHVALNSGLGADTSTLVEKLRRLRDGVGPYTTAARKAIRDAFAQADELKREILDAHTEA